MHLYLLSIYFVIFQGAIAGPAYSLLMPRIPQPCDPPPRKLLVDPNMTCDKLKKNTCFYTVQTFREPESATTSIVDWNCISYGEDHFLFNHTKPPLSPEVTTPVIGRIWTVSNLTRLNAPKSSLGISSYNEGNSLCFFPNIMWQGKKYLIYLCEKPSFKDLFKLTPPDGRTYRAEIPC